MYSRHGIHNICIYIKVCYQLFVLFCKSLFYPLSMVMCDFGLNSSPTRLAKPLTTTLCFVGDLGKLSNFWIAFPNDWSILNPLPDLTGSDSMISCCLSFLHNRKRDGHVQQLFYGVLLVDLYCFTLTFSKGWNPGIFLFLKRWTHFFPSFPYSSHSFSKCFFSHLRFPSENWINRQFFGYGKK